MEPLSGELFDQCCILQNLATKIASNHLVVGQIMQHLEKEDLLRFSFVNKTWMQMARKALKHHKCYIILGKNPCRKLLDLNAALENQPDVFYNGIRYKIPKEFYCGKRKDVSRSHREDNCVYHTTQNLSTDHLRRVYYNLLRCIRFKYIKFTTSALDSLICPFLFLIPIILQENKDIIKEFRIPNTFTRKKPWTLCLEQNLLPNLKILEAEELADSVITKVMPNVRQIIKNHESDYEEDGSYNLRGYNGPICHLFTNAIVLDSSHPLFHMEHPPKWKRLKLRFKIWVDHIFQRFLWASNSIWFTLKRLECDLGLLADLVAMPNMPKFLVLKQISTGVNKKDPREPTTLLQAVNWEFAPNLQIIQINGYYIKEYDRPLTSHRVSLGQQFQSLSVRNLYNYSDIDATSIFPNITVLTINEEHINQLFKETHVFPYLQDLHLRINYEKLNMEKTSLDFLLGVHEDYLETMAKLSFEDLENLCMVPDQRSILNFRGLKRILVSWFVSPRSPPITQILSIGAAALICSKMPGLLLILQIDFRINPSGWKPEDPAYEHLLRYARITKKRDDWPVSYQMDFGCQN